MHYTLSFDCGVKTLAFVLVAHTDPLNVAIAVNDKGVVVKCDLALLDYDVINIAELEDTKTMLQKITALNAALVKIDERIDNVIGGDQPETFTVVIENQPPINTTNVVIQACITMYMVKGGITAITYIAPTAKNCVHFTAELSHSHIMARYRTNYSANKEHTRCNFHKYLEGRGMAPTLANGLIGHTADAFMQILGMCAPQKRSIKASDAYL